MAGGGAQRSHHGCLRCKQRRQKCDETRPKCGRCIEASTECSYAKQLKWGGRTNLRGIKAYAPATSSSSKAGPTVKSPGKGKAQPAEPGPSSDQPPADLKCDVEPPVLADSSSALVVHQMLNSLSSLPETSRMLLHHYAEKASQITSCHQQVQARICNVIIPSALQTPSLLYATLALSALHWSTLVKDMPMQPVMDGMVSQYMLQSLESLRHELQQAKGTARYALLATIRTLCVCEIHSGKANPGSWRVHVNGARALLQALKPKPNDESADDGLQSLTESWYASIESLAALTPRGLPRGQLESLNPRPLIGHAADGHYLDIYTAYKPDLNAIFKEIGAAAWERRQLDAKTNEAEMLSYIDLDHEAQWLECSIRAMFDRYTFYPGVRELLSETEADQFVASSEAYQHTALIHVFCLVRKLPASAVVVQESVKGIIECAKRISPSAGLSPWVMMTTPLFTAGHEALGTDRDEIRYLLQKMLDSLKIRNVERALKLLELRWQEESPDSSESLAEGLSETQFDFIPY